MKPFICKVKTTSIVFNLVICISVFLLYGCGSGGSGSNGGGGAGSIAFTLAIRNVPDANNGQLAAASLTDSLTSKKALLHAQTQDNEIDCQAHQLDEIEAYVYDEEGREIAKGGRWKCDDHKGIIKNVPAGDNRKIVILATDKDSGEYVYRGEKGGPDDLITVLPEETTVVGTIMLDPTAVPNPPVDFEASDGEFSDRIQLSWQNVKHEQVYYIYRLENNDWKKIGYTDMDITIYNDKQSCNSGEIWYKVTAYNIRGESDESNTDSGFPVVCAPLNVSATQGVNEVTLEWDKVLGTESYTVYWGTDPGVSKSNNEGEFIDITETSFSHTNLDTRRNYYVVTAIAGLGESDASEEVQAFPWLVSTIDNEGDVGSYSSIAISPKDDSVNISYYDQSNNNLKYAKRYKESGSWEIQTPDEEEVEDGPTDLAIDSSGYAHISYERYEDGNFIYYANNTLGEWVLRKIDNGLYAAIVVDPSGITHFSYDIEEYSLYYINTDMLDEKVSPMRLDGISVQDTSIALDSNNKVHISYYDADNRFLKYATNSSSIWDILVLDPQHEFDDDGVGRYSSITLDSKDKVHISYYDETNNGLKYVTNIHGVWEIVPLDSTGSVDVKELGIDTSIAVDSLLKAHISYYDAQQGILYYATNASGDWDWSEFVDGSLGLRAYTSIAVDASDNIHISYYDGFRQDLKYATKAIR